MDNEEKNTLEEEELESNELESEEIESTENDEEIQGEDQTVPLSAYLELKNKYKDNKKKLVEYEDKYISSDLKEYRENIKAKYLKGGYNEELADMLAEDLTKIKEDLYKKGKDNYELIDDDIEDLQTDPIFADIADYRTDIINKITEMKKKGIDINTEDAYVLVRGTKSRLKDYKTNKTQANVLNRKNRGNVTSNVQTASSSGGSVKYDLDKDDRLALADLQKMQPDAGWTAKKYYEMMKVKE